PDLGLAAWRSATILNSLTGKEPYPLPRRTAFTSFGLDREQALPAHTPEGLRPLMEHS
ncbi:MAG TPA: lysine 6-monooxygenase, partial [Streptomyces sp.]|nr:lysine 6-monooxygenase [Streptomyces sp.]